MWNIAYLRIFVTNGYFQCELVLPCSCIIMELSGEFTSEHAFRSWNFKKNRIFCTSTKIINETINKKTRADFYPGFCWIWIKRFGSVKKICWWSVLITDKVAAFIAINPLGLCPKAHVLFISLRNLLVSTDWSD